MHFVSISTAITLSVCSRLPCCLILLALSFHAAWSIHSQLSCCLLHLLAAVLLLAPFTCGYHALLALFTRGDYVLLDHISSRLSCCLFNSLGAVLLLDPIRSRLSRCLLHSLAAIMCCLFNPFAAIMLHVLGLRLFAACLHFSLQPSCCSCMCTHPICCFLSFSAAIMLLKHLHTPN